MSFRTKRKNPNSLMASARVDDAGAANANANDVHVPQVLTGQEEKDSDLEEFASTGVGG